MSVFSQGPVDIGVKMESWLVKFDKDGECISPKTRAALLDRLNSEPERPVILFSHGWNNDFDTATGRYRDFLLQFERHLDAQHSAFKPVFVGIVWPSIWLSFDEGMQIAGAADPKVEAAEEQYVTKLATALPTGEERQRLYALLEGLLDGDGARELALLLANCLQAQAGSHETAVEDRVTPVAGDLLAAFQAAPAGPAAGNGGDLAPGGVLGGGAAGRAGPQGAGLLSLLDPRWALRIASVYQMKDRAGIVGGNGVAALLRDLQGASDKPRPLHLVGHSYGCKVVLSALLHAGEDAQVQTVLLLQPAMSHLAFADTIPDLNQPGGYQVIPDRVKRSLVMTYSANDFPLHNVFHLALRREGDIGDLRAAATGAGDPPNAYAALGGYGPRHAGELRGEPLPPAGTLADLPRGGRPVAFDGSDNQIMSHGDVTSPLTAWLLYLQTL